MRWLAFLAVGLLLAGCADPAGRLVEPADTGVDLDDVKVTGVRTTSFEVASFDGTPLATVLVEPTTTDRLRDGQAPRWPMVVFLHGWAGSKETWLGGPGLQASLPRLNNTLEAWAMKGFVTVAYDARGFGQSGGLVGVAGPDEIRDLQAVIDTTAARTSNTGYVGLYGVSYGAGQALQALSALDVDAVVASSGWTDLYEGLVPGNVPRLAWAEALYAGGLATSAGRYQPFIHDWYTRLYTRADMPAMRAEMDLRNSVPGLAGQGKPLLLCQGMQESLFPQVDEAWEAAGGFTRTVVTTGGHGMWPCEGDVEFMQFFLQGRDTNVDTWPALQTVDAAGGATITFDHPPTATWLRSYLREGDLAAQPSEARFTIEQRFLANPLAEPGLLWDRTQEPHQAIPAPLRQDPTGVFFSGPVLDQPLLFVGSAQLHLHAVTSATPYQVVATLFLERDGSLLSLSRGAVAVLDAEEALLGNVQLDFPWTKVQLEPGDRIVLKIASNDPSTFMPLLADYAVTFDGHSRLDLPSFQA